MKNKILLLGPTPLPHGGIVTYCEQIMTSFLRAKYCIRFFDITIPMRYRPTFSTNKKVSNIFIRDGFINSIKQILFVLLNYIKYFFVLISNRIKVIHIISCTGLGFWRNGLFILLSKIFLVKSVFHVVGEIDVFWDKSNYLGKKFISFFLNISDVIIVQSDGLKDIVSQMTKTKIITIINGVDTSVYKPLISSKNRSNNKFQVTTVGVLGRRKGYFDIIELAKRLKEFNINFNFIGGGEINLFKKIISENHLSEIITIHHSISSEDKIKILQNSDIFLLPSHNEGQPIAILEAFCCGLPIVSSNVGAIPEIIKKKNGDIITPGNISEMEKIVKKYYNDINLLNSVSKNNALEANPRFSLDRVFNQIEEVYLSL